MSEFQEELKALVRKHFDADVKFPNVKDGQIIKGGNVPFGEYHLSWSIKKRGDIRDAAKLAGTVSDE